MQIKLLKDVPGLAAGTLLDLDTSNPAHAIYRHGDSGVWWTKEVAEARPDMFEPVPPDYYALMQGELDARIGAGTYDAVRQVLAEFSFSFVKIGDAIQLDVNGTPVQMQDLPEDVTAAVSARLDAVLFAGAFEAVKAVIRGMGFGEVTLVRNASVALT